MFSTMPLIREPFINLNLTLDFKEINNGRQCHVERNYVRDVMEHRSSWLPNWIDCVDDRMSDSGDPNNSEEPWRYSNVRLGQNEEQSDGKERNNIFQVIQVSSSASLNIFMRLHFETFAENTIFRARHSLRILSRSSKCLFERISLLTLFLRRW